MSNAIFFYRISFWNKTYMALFMWVKIGSHYLERITLFWCKSIWIIIIRVTFDVDDIIDQVINENKFAIKVVCTIDKHKRQSCSMKIDEMFFINILKALWIDPLNLKIWNGSPNHS